MAILNAWQRLDRVLPGQPWGDGSSGSLSSATIPTVTKDSCTGTATTTTLTTGSATFSNGDVIAIWQSRGTGVGQWEINKVASGGGSTSLTLSEALHYSYTTKAQVQKILMYTTATQTSGSWTVPVWNDTSGGVYIIAAKTSFTSGGTLTAASAGYVGGLSGINNGPRECGEGTDGGKTGQTTARGNGGGGANILNQIASGGGGGHVDAGGNGNQTAPSTKGDGGNGSVGSTDLTNMVFGGAGGGSGRDIAGTLSDGANGGGMIVIFAKDIQSNYAITVNGGSSGDATHASGGAGAGGSVLLVCETATLGTNTITALAGTPGTSGSQGGTASNGRIAVHHSGTVTGTTNPTFTNVTDTTLVESSSGGSFLCNFI